jgi:Mg/Co/Ni transporter MgtE
LIYGEGFNVVIKAVEEDFKMVIVNRLKKKALADAIKRVAETKKDFNNSELKDEEIEAILNSLLSKIGEKEKLF